MENGKGMVREMIKIMKNKKKRKINVINMRYGENVKLSNYGRIGEMMKEVIKKYGVVWVY
jgi:hypothetical protein